MNSLASGGRQDEKQRVWKQQVNGKVEEPEENSNPRDKGIKMEWGQKRMKSYINIAEGLGKMKTKRSSE